MTATELGGHGVHTPAAGPASLKQRSDHRQAGGPGRAHPQMCAPPKPGLPALDWGVTAAKQDTQECAPPRTTQQAPRNVVPATGLGSTGGHTHAATSAGLGCGVTTNQLGAQASTPLQPAPAAPCMQILPPDQA